MEKMTEEMVMSEINALKENPFVKLAAKENNLKLSRLKKRLYQLRWMEKRGRELSEAGITMENIGKLIDTLKVVNEE